MHPCDVEVRGDGIVGRALALALARVGLRVALRRAPAAVAASAAPSTPDIRAYALNATSVALLERLRVWDAIPAGAKTAVHDMDVRGDAPGASLAFSAWEQRVGELAVIVDAAAIADALDEALSFAPHVVSTTSEPAALASHGTGAALVAHAEGRDADTLLRTLDAGATRRDYGQSAIAARLVSSRPHGHVAHQWFGAPDVLALLPFDQPEPGRGYALVWSLPSDRAASLLTAGAAAFEHELMAATGGWAGTLTLASDRASWPLFVRTAERWCGPGWVLLGDAAHVVHPLAGQGLNLGLADVAVLAGTIEDREPWRGIGDERLLRRYARQRAGPASAMLRITDGLQRLFAAGPAPLRELRNNGLVALDRLSPLKRWITARALDAAAPPERTPP